MRRLVIISVLFAVVFAAACRSPEEDAATREAVWATTVTHWATQTAPTPSPLPLTATVKAYIDNQWATVLAPTPPPDPTREAVAATTAAYRFAEQTAVIREWQLLADYEAGRAVVVTVTPVSLPTVPVATPTPVEVCALVDLNTALIGQIADLPADALGRRLGLERAGWIVAFRDIGGILNLDELLNIPGIGPRTVAAIRASECTLQK